MRTVYAVPKPPPRIKKPRKPMRGAKQWGVSSKPRKEIPKVNPERQERTKKAYSKGLRKLRDLGIRTMVIVRANFACQLCGCTPEYWWVRDQIRCPDLHVHHGKKRYKGFGGCENTHLLFAICRWCHNRIHAQPSLEELLFLKADPSIGMEPVQ